MNKVIFIGNLVNNPELTQTPSGVSVCKFRLAVQRDYANSEGNKDADFFNVVVWRAKGENCAKFLKKGNKAGIVGKLENREYIDKDGNKRFITEVIAEDVEFLTPKEICLEEKTEVVSITRTSQPRLEPMEDNQLPF